MSKKETLIRRHVKLDRDDNSRFEEIWGSSIGVSAAIRLAMRRFLQEHEARTRRILDNMELAADDN